VERNGRKNEKRGRCFSGDFSGLTLKIIPKIMEK
jgi:hypothetical protein